MIRAPRTRRSFNRSRLWLESLETRVTPTTIPVSTLNDMGQGSLRQAIIDANFNPGPDTIEFTVAGTIQLTTGALPTITDTVKIDGRSAPGFLAAPVVEIDAHGFAGLFFEIGSNGSSLLSLAVGNANGAGVTLDDSNNNVAGNYIGLALDGSTTASNVGDGLVINSSSINNIIGGTSPLDRNVISGNTGDGITVSGSTRNQIVGNFIGPDASGLGGRGNGLDGILLTAGAAVNNVGGTIDAQRNIISCNAADGVSLEQGAHDNIILGNFIGTDVTGLAGLGNGLDGVHADDAANNVIGNTVPVKNVSYFNANLVSPTPNPGWTGIRASDTSGNYLISGISGTQGLLYEGTISGAGVTIPVNFPNASASAVYGPDNLGGNHVALVGSYNVTGTGLADQKGFIFEGTTADLTNPANYTTIDAGGDFNIVHSTMQGLAVGNSDSSPSQGQASLLSHAFLYDVASGQFLPDIVFPGSVSNTAYGIWFNGGTSYTICGGWSSDPVNNFDDQNRPIGQGYLVDYDSLTQTFTNWTSFQYPFGKSFFTHFEGISSVENGVYTLNADSFQVGTTNPIQGSWVSVRRNSDGSFSLGQWTNLAYPGTGNITSSNSVYGNQVVGVVFHGATAFAFQATVNIGFQLSNVIGCNADDGVLLTGGATANTIASNFIGLDLTGKAALANGSDGVEVENSQGNLIGTTSTGPEVNYFNTSLITSVPVSGWEGIRQADLPGQFLISGTSGSNGLLFEGTIDGVGTTNIVDYPGASSTFVYGPDNEGSGNLGLVGTYKTANSSVVNGFLFQGTVADLGTPANFQTINKSGATFNYLHSTMGGLIVGNYDSAPDHGQGGLPFGPGHATIYDIATQTYLTDIVFPGSKSNSVYGIWFNGGTSYTVCGGYSPTFVNNFDDQNRPIGQAYLANYDTATGQFSHFTSFSYPFGTNFLTHFEGISSVEPGVYTLAADSIQSGSSQTIQASWVVVRRNPDGSFGTGQWVNLDYPGVATTGTFTGSDSVYGNQVVGIVVSSTSTFCFQATVNVGTQMSNIISGNSGNGVLLNVGAQNNQVAGNFIGTDATGSASLGNSLNGVQLEGANNNVIGNNNPITDIPFFNTDSVSVQVSGWQGIRNSDTTGQFLITGTSGTNGLLFDGTIAGVGTSYQVNFPNAATTSVYGPDNQGSGNIGLVGSYKNSDADTAAVKVNGFAFQGTVADLGNSANYQTIDIAGAEFNYVHSTMNGLAVGNYDSAADHGMGGLPLGPGHAFIYDLNQHKFLTDIMFPGSLSNTAYGIWFNGNDSYTICGGWSPDLVNNLLNQDQPIGKGYLVDYNSKTGAFTHFTSFDYPFGTNFVTHFEGISSVEKGVYTLSADSVQAGSNAPVQGSFVSVLRNTDGSFGSGQWINLNYPGLNPTVNITSSNSVYGNAVVGIVIGANPFSYQATVNVGFQLSNVISGNGGNGIELDASNGNQIAMNNVGTDLTGSRDLGNFGNGVLLTGASANNMVGGVATGGNAPTNGVFVRPPEGNLISGNDQNGVLITDLATHNQLSGNFIGTTAPGNSAMGNALDGVAIDNAPGNSLIGCTFQQDPFVFYNVIDGNGGNGLRVTNSDNTTFQANFLGLGADNSTPVGNALDGALINGSSANIQFGGVIPLGNVDAANGRNGVEIADTASGGVYFNTFCGLPAFVDTAVGNTLDGFLVTSTGGNNTIRTNVVSGNKGNGIHISGNATGVQVTDTIVGLNTSGTTAIPNGANGILLDGNAHDNNIGGFQPSVIPEVTIAANGANGIAVVGNAKNNTIFHSLIGLNISGLTAIGNAGAGIFVGGAATGTIIGGTGPGQKVVVSGNLGGGIQLSGQSQGTQIIGSLIGTNKLGTAPVGNHGNGITIVSSGNSVGGTAAGQGNTVAFNSQFGIVVDTGTGNGILSNSIFNNGSGGILLTTGGNLGQPAPVLTFIPQTGSLTATVNGTLTAVANTTYTVQLFASSSAVPGGQGQFVVSSFSATTNGSGVASFSVTVTIPSSSDQFFTATATDPNKNTSMFSAAVQWTTPNAQYVTSAYQLLLGRMPDASGGVFWVNQLNAGASPASVVLGIQGSSEYLTDQVFALYGRYLDRAPESTGAEFWTNFLIAGGTFEQVAEQLISSPEYFQAHGATNAGFVLGLYADVFGRTPSRFELASWVIVLDAGASRLTVATDFLTSLEYRQDLVESDYDIYLGRTADQNGLNFWVNALNTGSTDQEVLAGIFGSPEGFAKWS
ncbi:unnamed protein product [uncultured bacterium]|nr:unnamed protein product [uncultured bacterium]